MQHKIYVCVLNNILYYVHRLESESGCQKPEAASGAPYIGIPIPGSRIPGLAML